MDDRFANPPLSLHKLLRRMEGKNIASMEHDLAAAYLHDLADQFSSATSTLPRLILGDEVSDQRWVWQCEEAAGEDTDWAASFSIIKVDHFDQADQEPARRIPVKMAAVMFPGMKFTVDLFAQSAEAGLGAEECSPRIKITVSVCGDPELMIAEAYLEVGREYLPNHWRGITLKIVPGQNECDGAIDPSDPQEAFRLAADSARQASVEPIAPGVWQETVFVEANIGPEASVIDLHKALIAMGNLFTSASNALIYG